MYSLMSRRIERRLVVEQELGQARASSVFPTPVGPRKMNEPMGRFGSLSPARARRDRFAHGRDGPVLADDAAVQLLLHGEQLVGLLLQHALHRDAGPLAHHLGDVVRVDRRVGDALVREPGVLGRHEGRLDLVGLLLELGGALVVLGLHRRRAFAREVLQAQLHLAQVRRQHRGFDAQLAGRLVQQVDGLVGQETVADVSLSTGSRRR